MHLILLSGGSGKRLWPLSNDIRSKQFLKVLPGELDKKTGGTVLESMVQRVYRQLSQVGGWQSITVAAGNSQRDQLELQLGKSVNVVIEPERRDTFPAIALACSYIYDRCNVGRDEAIAVLPVDAFVENTYFEKISEMENVINNTDANLVLLGAKPLFPSEKYGYIVPSNNQDKECSFAVKEFKEKPTVDEASKLLEQGALWNCGVFGLRLGYVLDILKDKYDITDYTFTSMEKNFMKLNKTSF